MIRQERRPSPSNDEFAKPRPCSANGATTTTTITGKSGLPHDTLEVRQAARGRTLFTSEDRYGRACSGNPE